LTNEKNEQATDETVEVSTAKTTKTAAAATSHDDFDWSADDAGFESYSNDERKRLEVSYNSTFQPVVEKQVVKGVVVGMNEKDVVVNIGFKSDGLVPRTEFRDMPELALGDSVEVFVDIAEDKLGQLILSRKKALQEIEMPPEFKTKVDSTLSDLDPTYAERGYNWGEGIFNHANYYKGGNLVYLHIQLPNTDSTPENQNMTFDVNDSVIGIYQILFVESIFKDGRFTQQIKGVRDLTIPSQFIPRSNINEVTAEGSPTDTTWESFVKSSLESDRRAVDDMRDNRIRANTERMEQQNGLGISGLTGEQGMGAAGRIPNKMSSTLDEDVATARTRYDLARSKAELPTVRNPVQHAEELTKSGYTKDQAYKVASEQWEKDKADYFGRLNQVTRETYNGTNEQPITKYRPYDAETMARVAGDGGLGDWKRGNTQRPGPWALNNPAGLGQDVKTGRYYQYPTLEDGLRAQHEYYNYGTGVPVGSTTAGGTKLPDRYLLPTQQPTYEYNRLTGQYKETGTQPATYNVQQQLDYIKKQNSPRLPGGGR
jgi:hypothetical protein